MQCLYGAQFDVMQSSTILEKVLGTAVAGEDAALQLGPALLQSLIDRQRDHVAGIQVFVNSLKVCRCCLHCSLLGSILTEP